MKRRFNNTGVCVSYMHYMADTSLQMKAIFENLIEYGEYFQNSVKVNFSKKTIAK